MHDLDDEQIELLREFIVPRVVSGHGHNRAGAITGQHVVGDPDRDALVVDRVDRVGAKEDARLFLCQFGAFQIALGRGELAVVLDGLAMFGQGDLIHQPVFGGQHHVGGPKQRVRPGGENGDLKSRIGHGKGNLGAFAPPNPVPLHFLERMAPVDALEIPQQSLGVGRDPQHPLAHRPAHDRIIPDLASAIDDFFVGQDSAQFLAPPDGHFTDVGQTLGIAVSALLFLVPQFRRTPQSGDRLRLVGLRVEPRVVNLKKDPLGPLEVARIRRVHFPRPVVAEAKGANLPFERGDVRLAGFARVLTGLDGVLLRRQAKGVPPHRVQNMQTPCALITGQDVRRRIALGVSHVQAGPRRVGEHVQDVKLGRQLVGGRPAGKAVTLREGVLGGNRLAWIPRPESLVLVPMPLPLGLN